jgi:hypothetical protein
MARLSRMSIPCIHSADAPTYRYMPLRNSLRTDSLLVGDRWPLLLLHPPCICPTSTRITHYATSFPCHLLRFLQWETIESRCMTSIAIHDKHRTMRLREGPANAAKHFQMNHVCTLSLAVS